jgi:coiled-coil domain-containing protein 63/114
MPRGMNHSDDSDDENVLEAELEKLQLNYKVSEQQRLQYSIEVQKKIRLQNQLIKNLEQEKEELMKDLRLAESKTNEIKDENKTEKLGTLLENKDKREKEIKDEKERGKDLDFKLQDWERKIRGKRKEVGGSNAGANFAAQSKKQEKVFENRLDHALKSFNTYLTQNAHLRNEIDNLRVERNRFEELHKKLEKQYQSLRQQIAEVIENSTSAYDQREEAQAKMVLMRDKEDKDKVQLNAELKELIRVIDHDKKLKEFMKIKTQERQEDEELVTWRKKKESEAAEKRKKEREEHSVEAYETKFKEIEQITGENDLDKLVERFIQVENKNYALFNYVNELNNQVELLQEQIDQIKTDIRQFEKQGIEMEEQRKRILRELEQKYRNATQLADEYEEKIKENKKILDQSRIGIESLFKKINCDRSQIDILLLSKEGVTETNMSQYLGIIDSRTDELLKWQSILAAKKDNVAFREKAPNYIGEGAQSKKIKQFIPIPSTGDGHEIVGGENELDDASKPLSRAELHNRVIDGVRRKELEAAKEGYQFDLGTQKQKQKK